MEITVIAELLQVALPTGLVVVGIWWVLAEGWPYWRTRDAENRQREHDRAIEQVTAQKETARATSRFADALEAFTCVLTTICGQAQEQQ
jgi:hypothetical protein